jgi:hypothetical protein
MVFSAGTGTGEEVGSHQTSAAGKVGGVSAGVSGLAASPVGTSIHHACARSGGTTVEVGNFTSVRGGTVMS